MCNINRLERLGFFTWTTNINNEAMTGTLDTFNLERFYGRK